MCEVIYLPTRCWHSFIFMGFPSTSARPCIAVADFRASPNKRSHSVNVDRDRVPAKKLRILERLALYS